MSLFKTSEIQKNRIYEIAKKMESERLDIGFIADAVKLAEYYEGAYDLFCLWAEEYDQLEKERIIFSIQNEIKENTEYFGRLK